MASAGWKAEATTGAEAAPPTLAWLPTARKKTGALMRTATRIRSAAWMLIHTNPTAKSSGFSTIAARFMFIPMDAIST